MLKRSDRALAVRTNDSVRKVYAAVVACTLAGVASGCQGPGTTPTSLIREVDGSWRFEGNRHYPWFTSRLTYRGERVATNSGSAVGRRSHNSGLRCRHIAVFARSDDRALRYAAIRLQSRLSELPFVDRVDYFPPGVRPDAGADRPDVTASLRLAERRGFWIPGFSTTTLAIEIEVETTERGDRFPNHEWSMVNARWSATPTARNRIYGFSTHRLMEAAEATGDSLADEILRFLRGAARETGLSPTLPDVVLGEYRAVPEDLADILRDPRSDVFYSSPGPLTHNETYAFTEIPEDEVLSKLLAKGWEKDYCSGNICLTKGRSCVMLEPKETAGFTIDPDARLPPDPATLKLHYVEAVGHEQRRSSLLELLEHDLDLPALEDYYANDVELRQAYAAALERKRWRHDTRAHVILGRYYGDRGDRERARMHLTRARVLDRVFRYGGTSHEEQIAAAADKIELGEPSVDVYRSLGFMQLPLEPYEYNVELRPGDRFLAFYETDYRPWVETIAIELRPDPARPGEYLVFCANANWTGLDSVGIGGKYRLGEKNGQVWWCGVYARPREEGVAQLRVKIEGKDPAG